MEMNNNTETIKLDIFDTGDTVLMDLLADETTKTAAVVDEKKETPAAKPDVKKEEEVADKNKVVEKPLVDEAANTLSNEFFETTEEGGKKDETADAEKRSLPTDYSKLSNTEKYNALVAMGEWEEVEFEEGVTPEDADAWKEILDHQKQFKAEKGLTESEKDYLSLKDRGFNVKEYILLEQKQEEINAVEIESTDPKANEENQNRLIYTKRVHLRGDTAEEAQKYITKLTAEEKLQEAETAKVEITGALKAKQGANRAAFEAKEKEANERVAKYKKDLLESEAIKDLKPTEKSKVVDALLKRDANGNTELDNAYLKTRGNPKLVHELYEFLSDKDKFLAKYKGKAEEAGAKKLITKRVTGDEKITPTAVKKEQTLIYV